jgi:hypothetical protein
MASPIAPLHGARTAYNSAAMQSVQPPSPWIYLKLQFEDPDGVAREFPEHFPVTVRFSPPTSHPAPRDKRLLIAPGGILSFPARDRATDFWKSFTLQWDEANPPAIVCEPFSPPGPQSAAFYPDLSPPGAFEENYRFFTLPKKWTMRQGDWRVEDLPAIATFVSPPAIIRHTGSLTDDIGSPVPAKLTLLPHWHFAAFEFYDRYYGNAQLDSPPRAAVTKRISIPPVRVSGYSDNVFASPPSPPDSISNWVSAAPGKPGHEHVLQSVPFIIRRSPPGTLLSPPDGDHFALRFDTAEKAHVWSASETDRKLKYASPPELGPERLKYYDLPRTWKSWGYYTRRELSSPPAPGKSFGNTLTAAEIAEAEQKDHPLVFSLDDFVLVRGDKAAGTVSDILSPPADRIAIFNHRFDDQIASNPNTSKQGLYKYFAYPYGDEIGLPGSDVVIDRNYIYDYPDWTRLAIAQGTLFDIFNLRTTDAISPPGVVGARAAVCWDHADDLLPNGQEWSGGGWGPLTGKMRPGGWTKVDTMTPRIDIGSPPWFASQRFFHQRTPRWQKPLRDDANWQQGRYDIAFARCSDIREGNEVAVNLNYFRYFFDWTVVPGVGEITYVWKICKNIANRWSGDEPGISDHRAWLIPRASPPPAASPPVSPPASPPPYAASPPPLRTNVVWYAQGLDYEQGHFLVELTTGAGARDDRGAELGTGHSSDTGFEETSVATAAGNASMEHWFAAAHETGHMGALPDEYNERWNAQSFNQMGFRSNLPGDPYEADGRDANDSFSTNTSGMMNGNKTMRNRYFWPAAEWVREIMNYPMSVKLGDTYNDYWLSAHPRTSEGRTYYCWPMAVQCSPPLASPPLASPPVGSPPVGSPPVGSPPVASPPAAFVTVASPPIRNRAGYDLYVYALGRDSYSATELAGADGIVVITVRINCTLSSFVNANARTTRRNNMLAHLAAGVEATMNDRFNVRGTVNGGTPEAHYFSRCAVRFQPQFLVTNYPHEVSPPVVDEILADYGDDFKVNIIWLGAQSNSWVAPNRVEMTINSNAGNIDGVIARHYPRMLGINKVAAAVLPADLQPILQLVMPDAVVF